MLRHLTLRDFAVVSNAELAFDGGLTVVSGETGAGKSLLVGALLSLTGARADAGLVRHGAERAELAAEFQLQDAPQAANWLRENELDDVDTCQLRRVIRADGGSRAWINGRPATLAQLAELGAMLVEIHGQHEHQALLERSHQLELVDAFGQHGTLLSQSQDLARQWATLERQLAELARAGAVDDRIAYLEHQVAELADESLDPSGIEELLAAHRRQTHAASLLASYDTALAQLSGEDGIGVARNLRQVTAEVARQREHEPRLADVSALVDSARIQLDEAASLLQRWRDELELDESQLLALESRLTRLHELSRKHKAPLGELGGLFDRLRAELERLRGLSESTEGLARQRDGVATAWQQSAAALTQSRQRAADRLSAAVSALMSELGMAGGVFKIDLQANDSTRPNPAGAERCEFLVSANPGQPPRALRKVASGGELARISLAIEVAALGLDAVPSMVFDEVDSGIGGAVAEVVGQKLRALGMQRQVLCVTHLPQVAAQGHHHFQVSKAVTGSSTHSAVVRLSEADRIEELARMLGGIDITRESRANAKRMLSGAQSR
ncbi:MAG: DNA repair protein RecN [Frankiaceae bacterium]|nr:DNA repair protein RecN [Arenimonas sp.]